MAANANHLTSWSQGFFWCRGLFSGIAVLQPLSTSNVWPARSTNHSTAPSILTPTRDNHDLNYSHQATEAFGYSIFRLKLLGVELTGSANVNTNRIPFVGAWHAARRRPFRPLPGGAAKTDRFGLGPRPSADSRTGWICRRSRRLVR